MCLQFAQIVAKLVEAVSVCGEMEGGEDGLVDLACRPAPDLGTGVQQNLEQADGPRILDFDAGMADRTDGNGQRDPLQQGKVGMDVEHWAWNPANRLIMLWNLWRISSRWLRFS